MRTRKILALALASAAVLLLIVAGVSANETSGLTPNEELGKALFFDTNLSSPAGQSCATCHDPAAGWVGPDSAINAAGSVYPGAISTRFGDRKPPTAAYGGDSPVLYYDEEEGLWIGGMFWDGRATGWRLGDPLAEQAQGPFLNPVEQNMPGMKQVCLEVRKSDYADLYEDVWGSIDCVKGLATTYDNIAYSIAAYERSSEVNPFSSKFDLFWDKAGAAELDVTAINMENYDNYKGIGLDDEEVWGLALFNDEETGMCSLCHLLTPGKGGRPLFTDFTYDNLGIPSNPLNPANLANPDFIDPGLGGFLMNADFPEDVYMAEWGKHKVPTLRNVDLRPEGLVKAYGHNGFFKSLEEITHFYNTRDVESWPAPEYPDTVNTDELGNLGLTAEEESAIVAFMKTLSDGYVPE